MKKRSLILTLALALLLTTASPALAADSSCTLQTSDYTFKDEYDPISVPSYLINGDVYVPLHVFADNFGVTVDFDAAKSSINLDYGEAEAGSVKGRLEELAQYVKNTARTVEPTPHKLYVQGEEIELPMMLVDGYNFVQIDVIAEAFGFRAVRDAETHTIGLTQDDLYESPYLAGFGEYLMDPDNQIAIDTEDTSNLEGVNFDPYKVYLVGEQHAIAKNMDIELYFIKYLNQNQGVRHIISEIGFCDAMLLNRYLETGDASIIQKMVESTKGSFACSRDEYEFYERVYEYNKTLPQNQKLMFMGIDVQHNAQLGMDYLLTLTGNGRTAPQSVTSALAALESRNKFRVAEAVQLLAENENEFREYYGDQFDSFRYGLRSVEQGIEFYEKDDFDVREGFIHDNFRDYYKTYDMTKCFGMFGGAHTILDGCFDQISNLASYMNNEHEATKGKVCSIMTNYIDCFYMGAESGKSIPVTYSQSPSVSSLLDQSAKTDLALFPLSREGSPFAESGLTDSFQFYLCVKNSPAATPYGELGTEK